MGRVLTQWGRLALATLLLGCGREPTVAPNVDYLKPFIGQWTGSRNGATFSLVIARDTYQNECGIFGCPKPVPVLGGTGSYTPQDQAGTTLVLTGSVGQGERMELFMNPNAPTADGRYSFSFDGLLQADRTRIVGWLRNSRSGYSPDSGSLTLRRPGT